MKILVAILASGVMWFFSTGVNHVWPLAWLAPVPLLLVVPGLPLARAALVSFAAYAIGGLNLPLAYPRLLFVIGPAVAILAALYALVVVAWRAIAVRERPIFSIIGYAALVTATDYLVSLLSPHGTFGSLAYSQADVPVVIQLASVTGLWGITFMVSLVPASIVVGWRSRRAHGVVRRVSACALVPLALMLVYGASRLLAQPTGAAVRIGLVANDQAVDHFDDTRAASAMPIVRTYAASVSRLADRDVDIVVLPEKFVGIAPDYEAEARATLVSTARLGRTMVVAGLNLVGRAVPRNQAVVFGPNGEALLEYDKIHLVPGLEREYTPGRMLGVVPGVGSITRYQRPAVRVPAGVAICKDLDFTSLGRAYGEAGVGLLLVPAWDFSRDGWLHSRMALVRGVENGFAVARTANNGRLTISDARGRVVAETLSSVGGPATLSARVTVAPGGTFYTRTGDWFPAACILAVAGGLAVSGRRRAATG